MKHPPASERGHDRALEGYSAQCLMAGEHDETGIMKAVPRWPMDTLREP
ncbi:hypothetical protein [Halomonas sp.]|nr:hypothetical protein [Halomonas sp.]MDW7747901.1 hypothetical protein [Halomonas sp.]